MEQSMEQRTRLPTTNTYNIPVPEEPSNANNGNIPGPIGPGGNATSGGMSDSVLRVGPSELSHGRSDRTRSDVDNEPTVIYLRTPESKSGGLHLMLDNGSSVNLIKGGALKPGVPIDYSYTNTLSGITSDTIQTYGAVTLNIRNNPVMFRVVTDDFPIEQHGILGRGFLKSEQAILSYYYNTVVLGGDSMQPIPFETQNIPAETENSRDSYLIGNRNSPITILKRNNDSIVPLKILSWNIAGVRALVNNTGIDP